MFDEMKVWLRRHWLVLYLVVVLVVAVSFLVYTWFYVVPDLP